MAMTFGVLKVALSSHPDSLSCVSVDEDFMQFPYHRERLWDDEGGGEGFWGYFEKKKLIRGSNLLSGVILIEEICKILRFFEATIFLS